MTRGDCRWHLGGHWPCAWVAGGGRESEKRALLKNRGILCGNLNFNVTAYDLALAVVALEREDEVSLELHA